IVTDGWSLGVLMAELGVFYNAAVAGQAPQLAPLPVQYVDYALWQRELLSGAVLDTALEYWREQLAAVPALELPTDRPRPAVLTSAGALHHFMIPAELTSGLKDLSQRQDGTLFMTVVAARRHRRGHGGLGSGPGRAGRADRVFRQHPCAAVPGGWRTQHHPVPQPGQRHRAGRFRAPAGAFPTSGRRTGPSPGYQPDAVVPG